MKKHPPAPRKVVVLTLPVSIQNKVLKVLSDLFGINETYNRPQQFIMSPAGYGVFVAHISGWNSTFIEDIDHADPAHS